MTLLSYLLKDEKKFNLIHHERFSPRLKISQHNNTKKGLYLLNSQKYSQHKSNLNS